MGYRWAVSFKPWPLYPQGKSPQYPVHRRLGGPQIWSGQCVDWTLVPCPFSLWPITTLSQLPPTAQVLSAMWSEVLDVGNINPLEYDSWRKPLAAVMMDLLMAVKFCEWKPACSATNGLILCVIFVVIQNVWLGFILVSSRSLNAMQVWCDFMMAGLRLYQSKTLVVMFRTTHHNILGKHGLHTYLRRLHFCTSVVWFET
jgi:hypothetical protein